MRLTQIFKPIKSVSILTVLAACLAFTKADARKLSGQIVDRSGDIREVTTFNIPFRLLSSTPNFESMQYRIVYFNDAMTPAHGPATCQPHKPTRLRQESKSIECY